MLRKCLCVVIFEDGAIQVNIQKLQDDGLFALSEMEEWVREQSEKPIKSVKCCRLRENEGEIIRRLDTLHDFGLSWDVVEKVGYE